MNGAQLIAEERKRQINQEGWTPWHDAQWKGQELGFAARCYLDRGVNLIPHLHDPSPFWPWDKTWWKPSEEPIRNLIKAGALIAAEIDRRHGCAARWSVKPIFAWYDLWVGMFWDSRKRKLYILPLPCVGVVIEFPMRHNKAGQRPARNEVKHG